METKDQNNLIFIVMVDNILYDYCDDCVDAKSVGYDCINNSPREFNRNYHIEDDNMYSLKLFSTDKYSPTVYDRLEKEVKIMPLYKK